MGRAALAGVVLTGLSLTTARAREEFPSLDRECTNDHAGLVGKKDRAAIRSLCKKASKDGVHIIVVTVKTLDDYRPRPLSLDAFVDDLFDDWDITYDAANEAIMLFVARKERQIRIRMGDGYPDRAWKKARHILRRTVSPALGRRPSAGIRKGFARLYNEVAKPSIKAKKSRLQAEKRKRGVVKFE